MPQIIVRLKEQIQLMRRHKLTYVISTVSYHKKQLFLIITMLRAPWVLTYKKGCGFESTVGGGKQRLHCLGDV